ncbi:Hypothetical predicted protein [Paramuricea clavata]|uniref:NADH dehydrogenase [ubiquinone] iron-sulfur protein 5 n=1 Tax=Paramuricea clavata TaxID=317549 RepID=A0A6S7IWU1_PARCT|nr:Hypothetical predicted protein [Paramuricea clavata]
MSQNVSNDGDYGRCFQFWQELVDCFGKHGRYGQHTKCVQQKEDYDECLHHRKLSARLERIREEKSKLIKEGKWPQ